MRLGIVSAGDKIVNPQGETVSSMATRSGAVAGINGGTYDINASGQLNQGEIIDGEIWKSPLNGFEGSIGITRDGKVVIGQQSFSGTIAVNGNKHELKSINWVSDAANKQITQITHRLGQVDSQYFGGNKLIVRGTSSDKGASFTVESIDTADHIDQLKDNEYGLLASGDTNDEANVWIRNTIHVGDTVLLSGKVTPNDDLNLFMSGFDILLKDGKDHKDFSGDTSLAPRTAIGMTADGHMIMATFDGHRNTDTAVGATYAQVQHYLASRGVTDAISLDGGGSTTMVARMPGDTAATVRNTPSDGQERNVANGFFIYTNAPSNGRPQAVHINADKAFTTAAGSTVPLSVYAVDSAQNPTSAQPVTVTVKPSTLGTYKDGMFTASSSGKGTITAVAGDASASIDLTVNDSFASLTLSPNDLNLLNGQTGKLKLQGQPTDSSGKLDIDPTSASWKVEPSNLGTMAKDGTFTAASSGSGLATVTAKVGDRTASTTVAVGTEHQSAIVADDPSNWSFNHKNGTAQADAFEASDDVPEGSSQKASIKLPYTMPGTPGVHQLVFWPKSGVSFDKNAQGATPTSITLWAKIDDPTHSAFQVCISLLQANGQTSNIYVPESDLTFGEWTPITVQVPAGASFPLSLNWIDLLSIRPTAESKGTLYIGSMTADYSPRKAATRDVTKVDEITANTTKQYSAHGICQQGDNKNPEVNLPITDPVSHKWSTSDESVASIDPNTGLLTAHKEGDVEVRVTAGGITAVSKLHVKAAAAPVAKSVDTVKVTVQSGKTPQLPENVTVRFSDGSSRQLPVTWDAHDWSAEKAGTVTLAGTVTGTDLKAKAVVTITAASHNGTDQSQGSNQDQNQPSDNTQDTTSNNDTMAATGIAIGAVATTAVITALIAGTLMVVKRRRRL